MSVTQEDYWTQVAPSMVDRIIDTGRKYQLLEELGRGSYGCIFLGQSLDDNAYVAIKVLSKCGLDHQQLKVQHLEIDIQSTLRHSNLLALHGTTQDSEHIYMVMELCDQGDLFDFVTRNKVREDFVFKVFLQILEAVEFMHAHGVYHRDLKLENILLKTGADDSTECKVADFGLATRERYNLEFGCGSSSYLAPEHFDKDDDIDDDDDDFQQEQLLAYDAAASDVWSLGILLIGFLFGRTPWEQANSSDRAYCEYKRDPSLLKCQLFPEMSNRCYRLLKAALSPNPCDRPSVTELKHQFMALDRLTVDLDDESESDSDIMSWDDDFCLPVDIPATVKTSAKASFDSAVFSGTFQVDSSMSWSDMVEQDELNNEPDGNCPSMTSSLLSCSIDEEEEDDDDGTDVFVHSQEKASWWL